MYADVERHRLPLFIRLLQDILFYENSCIFYYIRLSKGGSHLSNWQLAQNRLGFLQVANQKTGNRLLTPESYYEIIPKTVFVYISYIVQMQMEPDNSECSPLPLKTAIPNRPPLAVQP